MTHIRLVRSILAGATLALCLVVLAVSPAFAAGSAWWHLGSTSAPTLLPHTGEAQIVVTATNRGYGEVNAKAQPVILTDELPAGVRPLRTSEFGACPITGQTVTCTYSSSDVKPYHLASMISTPLVIVVEMQEPDASGPLENVVKISGGGIPSPPALRKPLTLEQAPGEKTPFGVETYEITPEGEDGVADTQAGSHPFQLTTLLDLDQRLEPTDNPELPGAGHLPGEPGGAWPWAPRPPRNLHFKLPPGLIGDPGAVPRCSSEQFELVVAAGTNRCPADTAVGVANANVSVDVPGGFLLIKAPVFNLQPAPGEPARFGFIVETAPIILKTAVPAGGGYAVEVSVEDISQVVSVLSSEVTLWGVPGDPRHDPSRGWHDCAEPGSSEPCEDEPSPKAFLDLPTSCSQPLTSTVSGESWAAGDEQPAMKLTGNTEYRFPTLLTGCESLAFDPSFTTSLETPFASTPTGITGTLTFPQPGLTAPEGRAESALSDTTLLLPEGLQVNPSAANGLTACTEEQAGYSGQNPTTGIYEYTPASPRCPESSKVATLRARTPLLEEELTGALYVMEPAPNGEPGKNPFNALVGLYVVLEAPSSGILVKLGADIHLNEQTGREEGVFPGTPQLPFHEFTLSFFGGPRAATASPAFCGSYQVQGAFTGFSGATADPLSEPPFQITAGPEGSACPQGHLPFAPTFQAGPESAQAGALTPLLVKIGHPDGNQPLTGISVTEPPGFAGVLASVTPCAEPPPGVEWSCGEDSHIGEAREYSGLGPEPVVVTGQAYLTTGYDGAPFGLLVRTLAKAGPFDLGYVNVRSRINVNPSTAQVTVTTDPGPRGEGIPTLLKGVPVQLKALEVAVNRPGFTFNPTSCEPLTTTATLTGSEGAAANVSAPFKAEGCADLPFHPTLEASTQGQTSKAAGASLDVKVTSQGLGVANIQKVFLTIPRILPSRLQPTLQHACLAAVFEANPAACDEDSVIGYATVHTPILKSPLTGPAYVVSHGGAAFPDVEFVLQGEGITLILDGKTDIKNGVTYSRFESAPDAPFTTFETVLPEGPHSVLAVNTEEAPNYDLCGHIITIPTTITAQDGAVLEQTTKVAITGCKAVKAYKATSAQLLAKAMKACRRRYKRSTPKRQVCERQARRRYAPRKSARKATRATHRHGKGRGRRG